MTKIFNKRFISALLAIVLAFTFLLPLSYIEVSAAAPASYTTITADSTASVRISSSGSSKYFKFVPTQSGTYCFYSSNYTADPKASLLDANGNTLITDDDSGSDNNFSFTYACTAGTTYYVNAYMWSSSSTGSYTLNVTTVSVVAPTPGGSIVDINNSGTYSLFNSGATLSSGYKYSSTQGVDENPDSSSYSNSGYDIYGQMPSNSTLTLGMGLSFTVSQTVTEKATLTVYAYDVDEEDGERDTVHLVDETSGIRTPVGYLSGMDDQWNTTTIYIDQSNFTVGHTYHFENTISDISNSNSYIWLVYIRTVSLELITDILPDDDIVITNHSFDAEISSSGTVTTNLYLETNKDITYTLEYAASIGGNQKGSSLDQTISVSPSGTTKRVSFALESGSPTGTYQIDVTIKDSVGNTVTSYTTTAGYSYSAVSYDANGGSNNLPIDSNAYSNGDTVTVKFDYVPSMYGYTFLGWSTDRNATEPMYTENGTKTFTIGASDVTLYAVWALDVCVHEWTETSRIYATCTTDGLVVNTCSLCGDNETIIIPKLGHDYVGGVCSRCGAEENLADVWDGSIDISWYNSTDTEFTIYTAEQLAGLAQLVNNGNTFSGKTIYLGNNIDLANREWTPIGKGINTTETYSNTYDFHGCFNGNYHTIANMTICQASTTFTGLFGCLYTNAQILNLGIVDACIDIIRNVDYRTTAGILAGATGGDVIISNCYATGTVTVVQTGSYIIDIGGFVGDCYDAEFTNCYCIADVNAQGPDPQMVGVFCGWADDTIKTTNCFSYGYCVATGTGDIFVGGFGGGDVSYVSTNTYYCSSVYDDDATALTENELKNQTSFSNWDFINVWTMGSDYPVLRGFGEPDPIPHEHTFVETSRTEATCTIDGVINYACFCGDTCSEIIEKLGHDYVDGVCSRCGASTDTSKTILLIENYLCWDYDSNVMMLTQMVEDGYISDFEKCHSNDILSGRVSMDDYSLVVFAHQQDDDSYVYFNSFLNEVEEYVSNGGVFLISLCYGHLPSYTLPGNVTIAHSGSYNNYIVDYSNPIVTGDRTDGNALTDEDLYDTTFSHAAFTNLPHNAHTVFVDENNLPTLVDYPIGEGYIVASGLVWEWAYERSLDYARAYDDYFLYALNLADASCQHHTFVETSRTEATCTTDGVINYACTCGETSTVIIVAPGHNIETTVEIEVTCTSDGLIVDRCVNDGCDYENRTVIPGGHNYVETSRVEPQIGIEGSVTYTCTVCGNSYSMIIPPLPGPALPLIKVEDVIATEGSTVSVAVNIQNNPGVLGAVLTLTYDSRLTLVDAVAGNAWTSLNLTKPAAYTNSCNFVWDGVFSADTTNGSIIILTFVVPDNVDVDTRYVIDFSYTPGNVIDENGNNVDIEIEEGSISVLQLKGDANDDGVVDVADVIAIRRYLVGGYSITINFELADMNDDSQITVADIVLLRRYIVGE